MVAHNNSLIREGAALEEKWLRAQQACANRIRVAAGEHVSSSGRQSPAQLMAEVAAKFPGADTNITTAWGATGDRKESCGEKTLGFPAHLVGGVGMGLVNMLKGVSSLLMGWDGTGVPWVAELGAHRRLRKPPWFQRRQVVGG